MPVSVSSNFSTVPSKTTFIGFNAIDTTNTASGIVATQIPNFIVERSLSFQDLEEIQSTTPLNLVDDIEPATTALTAVDFFSQTSLGFTVVPSQIGPIRTPMRLSAGSSDPDLNPFKVITVLNITEKDGIFILNGNRMRAGFNVVPDRLFQPGYLNTTATGIEVDTDLNLIDVLGPQLFNILPPSGSEFNNPLSNISFDLIDTGGADIVASSIQIFVNGTQVVDAGADVTPGSFGSTIFVEVSDSFYQFLFIPASSYNLGSYVNVSGIASDDITPTANTTLFSYEFQIWDEATLTAEVTGLADVLSPFLENLDPLPFEAGVPVNSNILLDIVDEHTGVDFSSVRITVNDLLLISGTTNVNPDFAAVTITPISGGKSAQYLINPVDNLPFTDPVVIEVQASDLYEPSNDLDTSYFFITQSNAHLLASGLQILENSFIDMNIGESYVTTSSTQFLIEYINLLDIPIDISGSNVQLNGAIIPSTFTSVTGSFSHYEVEFELEPDYTTDSTVTFHVQQSGTVSGNIVSRDFTTDFLWGYEVCYDPGRLPRETDFFTTVQVHDRGDWYTIGSLVTNFSTIPFSRQTLGATIIGINPPSQDLGASFVSNSTFFEYGKTMNLRLEASDFAGNELVFSWSFTIEEQ